MKLDNKKAKSPSTFNSVIITESALDLVVEFTELLRVLDETMSNVKSATFAAISYDINNPQDKVIAKSIYNTDVSINDGTTDNVYTFYTNLIDIVNFLNGDDNYGVNGSTREVLVKGTVWFKNGSYASFGITDDGVYGWDYFKIPTIEESLNFDIQGM